jgi:hypothetical protein
LNGEIGFVNQAVQPAYRVFLTDTNISLENFSNQLSEGTTQAWSKAKDVEEATEAAGGAGRVRTAASQFCRLLP